MTASNKAILVMIALFLIAGTLAFGKVWLNIPSEHKMPGSEEEDNQSAPESPDHEPAGSETDEREDQALIDAWLQKMTLEEKIGQMLMPQIVMGQGQDTTEMNPELQRMIQDFHLGGVILFQKNIESVAQVVTFTDQIQQQSTNIPLLISIDQEGGLVQRIPGGTVLPGNMALGAAGDAELAYEAGRIIGRELQALGVNVNFAPVLDVNHNPDNPVIGVRSFSENPELVAQLGVAYVQGLQDTGIIATVKHFPGHGDTDVDSHLGLPILDVDRERLEQIELFPFRAAVEQGVEMIMTAHVTFPRLDDTEAISKLDGTRVYLPATLSANILMDLLREELEFDGVIVTDAFNMKAISDHFGEEDAVVQSIQAGADIILMPVNLARAYHRVRQEVEQGALSEERIDQSVRRILRLKARYGLLPEIGTEPQTASLAERIEKAQQLVGGEAHQRTEEAISKQAVTVVKNEENMLPFASEQDHRILVLAPSQNGAVRTVDVLQQLLTEQHTDWGGSIDSVVYTQHPLPAYLQRISHADQVLIISHNLGQKQANRQTQQELNQIIAELNQRNLPYAWMSIGTPYDVLVAPEAKTYLAVYGAELVNLKAGLSAIYGLHQPGGKLPVTISPDGYPFGHGLSIE